MAFESIKLNLIPDGEKPVFHAAQFDIGRPIIIEMYIGEDAYTIPDDIEIELQVRKVDNNIVTAAPDTVDGNTITFLTTEQMTACSGTNLCEIQFTAGDQTIATLHFYLVVQRDVLAGGLTSQSEIYDLEEQIAAIVPEVIGDEYYTAEEVDEKIAEIPTFDPTNYYTKSQLYTKTETNGLLSQKANTSSLATVATSGSYNDLTNKPTIPDVSNYYTKSETYNQTEVNNLLSTKADTSSLSTVATTGDYDDLLNKPTIPAAQVQSDWSQADNTKVDYIKNKPTIIAYGEDLPMSTTDPDKVADRIEDCETAISGKADEGDCLYKIGDTVTGIFDMSGFIGGNNLMYGLPHFKKALDPSITGANITVQNENKITIYRVVGDVLLTSVISTSTINLANGLRFVFNFPNSTFGSSTLGTPVVIVCTLSITFT